MKRGERKRGSGNFARTQGTASHGRFQMQAFKTTSPRSIDRTTCWVFFSRKKTTHPNEIASETHRIPRGRRPKTQTRKQRRPASSCSYLAAGRAARSCGSRPWLRPRSDRQTPSSFRPLARVAARREAGLKTGGRRDRGRRGRFGEGRRNGAGGRGAVSLGKFIGR